MNKKYAMPIEKKSHPSNALMNSFMKRLIRRKWHHIEKKNGGNTSKKEVKSVIQYCKEVYGQKEEQNGRKVTKPGGLFWGNLWRYPRIRKRLESSISRYVYPNSFDTRKNFRKFLLGALDIHYSSTNFKQQEKELKHYLRVYVQERVAKNKVEDVKQFLETFKSTLQLVDQKIAFVLAEANLQEYDVRNMRNPLAKSKDRKKAYYGLNTRDAFNTLLAPDNSMREAIPPLLRVADELKREFAK